MNMKRFAALTGVLLALCLSASAQRHPRAPYRFDPVEPGVHDPVLAKEGDTWYVFGTGPSEMTSTDLKTWTSVPGPKVDFDWISEYVPGWRGGAWAPDIIHHNGLWHMFCSPSSSGRQTSVICHLTRSTLDPSSPEPWKDCGEIIHSVPDGMKWNAIDANVVIADDGTPWMVFGSYWDGIQLVRLKKDLSGVDGVPRTIARRYTIDRPDIHNPLSTLAGKNAIEGAHVYKHGGWYYLFVSWDYCCVGVNSSYKVAVGRSRNVEGPYLDDTGKDMAQGGGRLVAFDSDRFVASGHCSAYTIDGKDLYLCHAYERYGGQSKLIVREIGWEDEWPVVSLEDETEKVAHAMVLDASKTGAAIQPTMYGVFFEDINFAADGGVYAEMVKNRSFDFPHPFTGWTAFGKVSLKKDGPFDRNPNYIHLDPSGHTDKYTGVQNDGFFGMGIQRGKEYRFSVWARGAGSKVRAELVNLESDVESQVLVSSEIEIVSDEWKQYETVMTAPVTMQDARLRVFLASATHGADLEHISLFPVDTWKGRKGGLRKDLVQALYDLHPGVFRFPGGCIVEGADIDTRYSWKNSVGPVENRPVNENRWHYTYADRLFPDYFQSYGLGFFEYFQLCEDLGAAPLPVISCGIACQFQNSPDNPDAFIPVSELQPYIQDALDLIEFANGATDTPWGKVRAEMGHPAPFNMRLLAVGNEQWGPEYPKRLIPFVKAIREKHPEIKIIGTSGPGSEGELFEYLWPQMRTVGVDLVDEHYYRPESWFLAQGSRYDNYDRKGPKVFAGEYACHGDGKKWNHFNASLLEAAFMTGLERNADLVQMATYAPLFAHVKGWQWRPDLIWFDNLSSVRSCSWYVQQLYSLNKGTHVASLTLNGKPVSGQEGQDGLFASAVWDADAGEYIVKIVNTSTYSRNVSISVKGLKKGQRLTAAGCTSFHSAYPDLDNTLENPEAVVPETGTFDLKDGLFNEKVPAKTFMIYRLKKN